MGTVIARGDEETDSISERCLFGSEQSFRIVSAPNNKGLTVVRWWEKTCTGRWRDGQIWFSLSILYVMIRVENSIP